MESISLVDRIFSIDIADQIISFLSLRDILAFRLLNKNILGITRGVEVIRSNIYWTCSNLEKMFPRVKRIHGVIDIGFEECSSLLDYISSKGIIIENVNIVCRVHKLARYVLWEGPTAIKICNMEAEKKLTGIIQSLTTIIHSSWSKKGSSPCFSFSCRSVFETSVPYYRPSSLRSKRSHRYKAEGSKSPNKDQRIFTVLSSDKDCISIPHMSDIINDESWKMLNDMYKAFIYNPCQMFEYLYFEDKGRCKTVYILEKMPRISHVVDPSKSLYVRRKDIVGNTPDIHLLLNDGVSAFKYFSGLSIAEHDLKDRC